MHQLSWIRSHVERCLEDIWDLHRVEVDGDGDYPFRWGTAACFIRVEPGDPPVVRVLGHAVVGVRPTGKLLREVNDVNRRTRTSHVFVTDHLVIVEQALHAGGVDRDTLAQACAAVGSVADDIGAMIAAVHGGHTPFDAEEDDTVDEEAS